MAKTLQTTAARCTACTLSQRE